MNNVTFEIIKIIQKQKHPLMFFAQSDD